VYLSPPEAELMAVIHNLKARISSYTIRISKKAEGCGSMAGAV